ncbi:MAG: hypothetical protein ABF264_05465 [Flavobacteriales bacterium]
MILIILVLVYVGILFKRLAEKHKKNPTAYAVLGIVVFLVGLFVLSFLMGLIMALSGYNVQNMNVFALEIVGYFMGGTVVWLVHSYLDRKWSKNKKTTDYDVIDDSWIEEDS